YRCGAKPGFLPRFGSGPGLLLYRLLPDGLRAESMTVSPACAFYCAARTLLRQNMLALNAKADQRRGKAPQHRKANKEPQKPVRRRPAGAGENARNYPLLNCNLQALNDFCWPLASSLTETKLPASKSRPRRACSKPGRI